MSPEERDLTAHEAKQKSPVELAFIGDAVYELLVREHITKHNDVPTGRLHAMCVGYVCAAAQQRALARLMPELCEEEAAIVRRGRNANKVTAPKNADPAAYRASTGIEALFGFLYLTGQRQRISELFAAVVALREQEEEAASHQTRPVPR